MKRIYLYIAVLISLVANIIFYSNMKKNENKVATQSEVVSDDYVSDELGKAYSYVKLNGKMIENVKGTFLYMYPDCGGRIMCCSFRQYGADSFVWRPGLDR